MQLVLHPDTAVATVQSIEASVWQADGRWHFRYLVEGAIVVLLPDPAEPGRADGLWRTTCAEAFVGLPRGAYLEFNFSPSGQWAAYRFDGPRRGMRPEPASIDVFLDLGDDWFSIEGAVDCAALEPGLTLGLSAVIEEQGGLKSHWALAHSPGPPDFHDRSCFTALLANIAAE